MPQMIDEAGWLRAAFDDLESAEASSLAHLLNEPAPVDRPPGALRSVATTAATFGFVMAASLLLGRPRD